MVDATMSTPGWSVVEDVIEGLVETTRQELLNCQSSDTELVFKLQLRARLAIEIQRGLKHELHEIVSASKRTPATAEPTTFLPGTN